MKVLFRSIITLSIICFVFACSKSTFVGSDLFVPDSIDLFYKDDFDIIAKTIRRDSVVTFDTQAFMTSMVCGRTVDPVFGTTEAEIFIDMHISNFIPPFQYSEDAILKKVNLDSVILVLAYEAEGFYGDSTVSHDLEVNLLRRKMIFEDTVYSTFRAEPSEDILGSKTFVPRLADTLKIFEPGDTSATEYTKMLRLKLDDEFAQAMIDDTSFINSDANFTNYSKGLRIKSTPNGNSMWAMDNTRSSEEPYNSVMIYYSRDTFQSSYRIFVDGDRTNHLVHDYAGSEIENFFDDTVKGDSLLFLHGLAGSDIELDIPALADPQYDEFLVNKAELEFFVLEDENSDIYDPLESILLQRYDSEGGIIVTEDVFLGLQILNDASFGGTLTETTIDGKILKKYTAVMSVHALRMFNDDNPDTKLRISARNKRERPNRSIIFGPGHSKYPMKFKLTYSK